MAILLCICLFLVWALEYTCAVDIIETLNTFNHSTYGEQSLDDGITEYHLYGAWGIPWQYYEWATANTEAKWHDPAVIANLPANFDPREKWSCCPSLKDIYDQGNCGSGWVFGSVTAITDRICIASNGTNRFNASAHDALTCSGGGTCADGGFPMTVYTYWKNRGIVSGGAYDSNSGCKPYRIPPCGLHERGIPCYPHYFYANIEPECLEFCDSIYENDREFAGEVYRLLDEDNIKADMYLNGPATAVMAVYGDFITHQCGVYRYKEGPYWYSHVVKLMGWGEEGGVKYWLAANSWNVEWGERGFFKIARGQNECGIETLVIAGTPQI